jgi:NAD-dependent DNA ligase
MFMTTKTKEEQDIEYIHLLVAYLNKCSDAYYDKTSSSSISDPVYDALLRTLINLENEYNLILDNSPTQRVANGNIESI